MRNKFVESVWASGGVLRGDGVRNGEIHNARVLTGMPVDHQ